MVNIVLSLSILKGVDTDANIILNSFFFRIVKWLQNKSRIIPVFEVSRCGKTNQQKRSIPMCTSINFTIIMQVSNMICVFDKLQKDISLMLPLLFLKLLSHI